MLGTAMSALNLPSPVVSPKPDEEALLPFFYKGRSQAQKT